MGAGAWLSATALDVGEGAVALGLAWNSVPVWSVDATLPEACLPASCVDMGAPQVVQNLQVSGTNAPHSVQYIVFLSIGCAHVDAESIGP